MRGGFVIGSEWFWRISENAKSFDAEAAVRDFLQPLARVAKDTFTMRELVADGEHVRFVLGDEPVAIRLDSRANDRGALKSFIADLNRALAATGHAFAIESPRRYELLGVLAPAS